MGLRMPELLVVGLIVVLLFGTKKLPELGAGLGQAIRDFKKGLAAEEKPGAPDGTSARADAQDGQNSR